MGKNEDTTLDQHVSGQANGNGLSKPAHALTFSQVTEDIKANAENGLSSAEAKERHSTYGTNNSVMLVVSNLERFSFVKLQTQ